VECLAFDDVLAEEVEQASVSFGVIVVQIHFGFTSAIHRPSNHPSLLLVGMVLHPFD